VPYWEVAIVGAAVAAGCFVQGGAGLGAALLAAPVVLLVEPDLVPGPLILALSTMTIGMTYRNRHHLDLSGLWWAVAGRLPGTALGAVAVAVMPAAGLDIGFGVMILVLVVASLTGVHVPPTPSNQLLAGGLSGLSGTATSVGGPPMALLLQNELGPRLRANLAAFFAIGTLTSIGGLVAVGEFGLRELRAGALLAIPAMGGFWISGSVARFLDAGRTRHAVLVISAASSLVVLGRGLAGL